MKIGFIGAGNMAGAIIKGIIHTGKWRPEEIGASNPDTPEFRKLAKETGILAYTDNFTIAAEADIIVLAVKPNLIAQVAEKIKDVLVVRKPLLISIAAGTPLSKLEKTTRSDLRIIRVMPNVNALAGKSASAVCGNQASSRDDLLKAKEIFEAVGKVWEIAESDFSTFAALAGCSPAYILMFIDALSRGAVKNGLSKALATEIAAQAVEGTARMLAESGENPWALVDKVCSPGGTTIEGVTALENCSFMGGIMTALQAAVDKDKKLAAQATAEKD